VTILHTGGLWIRESVTQSGT